LVRCVIVLILYFISPDFPRYSKRSKTVCLRYRRFCR
jgi:hypothetical protein